jgi:hypothetical protein
MRALRRDDVAAHATASWRSTLRMYRLLRSRCLLLSKDVAITLAFGQRDFVIGY